MKSKAQLLVEQINKIFEERGLPKPKEVKRTGSFVHIKHNKALSKNEVYNKK